MMNTITFSKKDKISKKDFYSIFLLYFTDLNVKERKVLGFLMSKFPISYIDDELKAGIVDALGLESQDKDYLNQKISTVLSRLTELEGLIKIRNGYYRLSPEVEKWVKLLQNEDKEITICSKFTLDDE